MARSSRRQFLEDSLLAAAALSLAPTGKTFAQDEKQNSSPNEKLGVAVVGVRGQGVHHMKAYLNRKDTELLYIADVDENVGNQRAEEAAQQQHRKPQYVADLRKALEDKSVDIVSIATPNHWHALGAIWSMQAGKDVYVEKPACHLMNEGKAMVAAARKHRRICQVGTQSRSGAGFRKTIEYIHSGKLGDIKLARAYCYKRRKPIGPKGDYPIPDGVHYDLWSGPAPILPLTRPQFHYDWHWQWPYGNGDLGNQGVHQMDIARWALGLNTVCNRVVSYGGRWGYEDAGETPNTLVSMMEFDDAGKTLVFEVRGLELAGRRRNDTNVFIYGSEGYAVLPGSASGVIFDPQGKEVRRFHGGAALPAHFANFIQAVRDRKAEDLHADIAEGHLSAALVHACNISYRLGTEIPSKELKQKLEGIKTRENPQETLDRLTAHLKYNKIQLDSLSVRFGEELALDPATLTFPGSKAANQLLTCKYRNPFVVPAENQV
ncbi:MAG: Gfo/Idh/MocA family oxidoreductase [Pirellulales bacterium]|nr:Gfo/Idh/MocA family oxidoreductase [Pirellulales bacterium]